MKENVIIGLLVIAVIVILGLILHSRVVTTSPTSTTQSTTTQVQPTAIPTLSQADFAKEKAAAVANGLVVTDTQQGSGKEAKVGNTVVMNYKGTLPDGTVFDSSYDRNQPFTTQIGVGQVIKGWDLGVPGMKVGGKRHLIIPSTFGYGAQAQGKIPANSTLIFDVELMDVK